MRAHIGIGFLIGFSVAGFLWEFLAVKPLQRIVKQLREEVSRARYSEENWIKEACRCFNRLVLAGIEKPPQSTGGLA